MCLPKDNGTNSRQLKTKSPVLVTPGLELNPDVAKRHMRCLGAKLPSFSKPQ